MRIAVIMIMAAAVSMTAFAAGPVKALVVTGGHGFEQEPFDKMFKSLPGVEVTIKEIKNGDEIFGDIKNWKWDVIVSYDMTQPISDKGKKNFVKLLNKGVGLVSLHHSIADYNNWPEYWKIIGAHYYLENCKIKGEEHSRSVYEHDVDFKVTPVDPNHPVTKGIDAFMIHDETYNNYTTAPDNHVLLTTDNNKSAPNIAWTRTYGKANVCYIELGHGPHAFLDDNYKKLVTQAIGWASETAPKTAAGK